jgi:hypothetical protein
MIGPTGVKGPVMASGRLWVEGTGLPRKGLMMDKPTREQSGQRAAAKVAVAHTLWTRCFSVPLDS